MNVNKKLLLSTSLMAASMIFTGCMKDGENGATALIKTTAEAAGDNCENGGTRVDIGLDDNSNGMLETVEIDSTEYICNGVTGTIGADGTDGFTTLVTTKT